MNNNNPDFLKKNNLVLLWEVISEDDMLRQHDTTIKNEVYQLILNNIQGFYDSQKGQNVTLIDMNKTYIRLIINYIHTHKKQQEKEKEKEKDERDKDKFEVDLTRKQNEFTSAMTKPIPPVPKFNDKVDEPEPMSEMALAIKQAQEQRNYDTEQVKKSYVKNDPNWLKPFKNEKIQNEKIMTTKKYIKINEKEEEIVDNGIIDLEAKKVSWQENQLSQIIPDIVDDNEVILKGIFNKLKRIPPTSENEQQQSLAEKVDSLNEKVDLILKMLNSFV
jgi:hypothetical protein